jgi:hypothetical protein
MKIRGWIYIITNNAMPGLVKIGYSTKDPCLRAKELDCTGTPHSYEVIYDALLWEPREVEQKVHVILRNKREGKEWFRCSIEDSIKAIRLASIDQQIIETGEQQFPVRFIAYDNGTVLDTHTGLMWAAKDNGSDISFKDAKRYCKNYRGGGYTDWRMPTRDDLAGLYDSGKSYKATQRDYNVHITELIQLSTGFPWASETHGSDAAYFNSIYGRRGWNRQSDDNGNRALPVRSGK